MYIVIQARDEKVLIKTEKVITTEQIITWFVFKTFIARVDQ